jgi:hypothetical protein
MKFVSLLVDALGLELCRYSYLDMSTWLKFQTGFNRTLSTVDISGPSIHWHHPLMSCKSPPPRYVLYNIHIQYSTPMLLTLRNGIHMALADDKTLPYYARGLIFWQCSVFISLFTPLAAGNGSIQWDPLKMWLSAFLKPWEHQWTFRTSCTN